MQPDSDLLHYETFHSKAAGEEVSCLVYLPPGYKKNSTARFPVLYWLHGSGGRQITGAGVVERLDKAIAAGKAPEMIVVLVNGFDTMYCDPVDGSRPVESVIMKDLIPHIDATYRTIADRKGRAIEGFSMGGFGAGHLGFKYPEVFGVVSILAPAQLGPELAQIADKAGGVNTRFLQFVQDLFGGDMQKFQAQDPFLLVEKNAGALRGRTHVRLHTHTLQTRGNWVVPRCQDLSDKLNALGLKHEFKIHWDINKHNYRLLYDDMGGDAFVFYQNAFAAAKEAKL
jgi:endo-1,4-beta-xylanase